MQLPELKQLQQIVIRAAREELLPRFTRVDRNDKADGSFITEADLAAQQRIETELKQHWPDIALLGEEMTEAEQNSLIKDQSRPLWILDPLDGTSNFAAGLPFFSTSLALLHQGEIVLGVVYDPSRDECFSARKGDGAWFNGQPLGQHRPQGPLKKGTALVDFKRLPAELANRLVNETPYSSQRSHGSVALDWCWMAAGRCHVYLHGKQKLWDYAAGYLVFSEMAGHACTLAGEPVFQPNLEPRTAVASLDQSLFQEWTEWLGIRPGICDNDVPIKQTKTQ